MAEMQPEIAAEDTPPVARASERAPLTGRFSLTARILIVNILPLALLSGGLFYLDTYRTQLINERFKLARIEAPSPKVQKPTCVS